MALRGCTESLCARSSNRLRRTLCAFGSAPSPMILRHLYFVALCAAGLGASLTPAQEAPHSQRTTLSLDGSWDIEDSTEPNRIPKSFRHTVPVPGLAHSASPGFADVDKYQTKQLLSSLLYYDRYSQADYDKLGN